MLIVPFHLSVQCWFRIMLVCTNTSHRNAHCTISFLKPQVLVCFSFKISISLSEYPSSQRSFLHPEAGTESLLVWMLPDRQLHPPYKSDCCRTFHLPSAHFEAVQHPWSLWSRYSRSGNTLQQKRLYAGKVQDYKYKIHSYLYDLL